MKKFLNRIAETFGNTYEYFYILDFGRFGIKAAVLKVDKAKNVGEISTIKTMHHRQKTATLLKSKKAREELEENIKQLFTNFKAKSRQRGRRELSIKSGQKPELIIGVSSELVSGHSFVYSYTRENPDNYLEVRDVKNVIHNAELKAYEEIRQKFVTESGYPATELCLINYTIQQFQIDGRATDEVPNVPAKELSVSIFNAYMPKFYKEFLDELSAGLKLKVASIIYTPYAVFKTLQNTAGEGFYAILIDVGSGTTRVSLIRHGKLEGIKSFSFGGDAFTKRIMKYLGLDYAEAERLKVRYYDGELSREARQALDKIMHAETNVFLNALNLILKEFSHTALLPSNVYLYGGGANTSVINGIIKKRTWKKDLSFTSNPEIRKIEFEDFANIKVENQNIYIQRHVPILALANYAIGLERKNNLILDKNLQRMVKLITS